MPDYPRGAALRRRLSGIVSVAVTVTADGRAASARIERSSGSALLDRAALDKVMRECRFHPAMRDGVPVQGQAIQPMNFVAPP